jgi:hypothetical protein
MGATYFIKQHDTAPPVTDTLEDSAGNPANLSGATVRFHMTDRGGGSVVNAAATGPNGGALDATGQVQYQWVAGDTATAGQFLAEWQVTFQGGAIETWPDNDQALVVITPDLA